MRTLIRILAVGFITLPVYAAEPVLSRDAPDDKPVAVTTADELERMHRAMEPYVREAKRTYPAARARFQKGLADGEHFFVTTRLRDSAGKVEQVFVAVTSIGRGTIRGIIYSPVQIVSGYTLRQPYSFPESELVDWLITKPDGSEEGNIVGKFLDSQAGD